MNKIELLQSTIKGRGVGRIPFSFWTHFPEIDRDATKIAQATYKLYNDFDLDFVKTLNNGMYSIEDYGTIIDFSEVKKGGVAKVIDTPIKIYNDFVKIKPLEITEGALLRELDYLEQLLLLINGEAPVIFMVFSPLTTLDKLTGGRLQSFFKEDTLGLIEKALDTIAETTKILAEKAIMMGAAGVYFASQSIATSKFTSDEFTKYGKPYDLKVLEGAQKGWFNAIHIHGDKIHFNLVKDYPLHVFNWHIGEAEPTIKKGKELTGKCIMGGLHRFDITENRKDILKKQIEESLKESAGIHHILTPGCGVRLPFESDTIRYIQKIKQEIEIGMFNN